jgi:hypothetical protein
VSAPPARVSFGPFSEVFATAVPTEPAQARIIADFREAMILWDKSGEDRVMVSPIRS